MNLLVTEQLKKTYGDRTVFEDVSFGINDGDKIGLVGINGTGKSTLLRIVAGLEEPDEGTVTMRSGLRIAYLPQSPYFDEKLSLADNVIAGITAEEEHINLRGKAAGMLRDLGLDDPECDPSTLSGGQRKRAALVRTLLTDSDLLILDEPTNHLDTDMVEWLEDKLKSYRGAVLLVTHDRYFLDEVTNRIFEIDKRKLYTYTTNYSGFISLKSEREASEIATERKARSLFRNELAWMMRGARARSTKQKAHIQRFEALRDRAQVEITDNVEMFSAFSRLGRKTIEADHLSKSFDRTVVSDFSYIFLQNDRIGIIGPNGCGKTTLVRMLTGGLLPDSGTIESGTTVRFGYFSQECESMDPNEKAIDYIRDTAEVICTREGPITASRLCERFLFDSSLQYSLIGKLSGGERRRLYLLKVLMEAPNVLILDEPTNDLDIMTLTILEDYLMSFEGIVITVSHDRYFLDKIVRRLFVFREGGRIEQIEGNYTDYREKELDRLAFAGQDARVKNASASGDGGSCQEDDRSAGKKKTFVGEQSAPRKFSYKEQKEFETIDDDIAALEAGIEELDKQIAASSTDYFKLSELMNAKKAKEEELEQKMDRWVYLNELAESIKH